MSRLIIGLTGGLASGKSTVARLFQALDVPVIDADAIARDVVAPGEPALEEIRNHFGARVFKPTGELDRAWLRQHIFAQPSERKCLEQILHPLIHARIVQLLKPLTAPYAILMIPLLLESAQKYPVNRVLVVDAPKALQLKRAAQRDGSDAPTLNGILAAQVDREARCARADDIIHNQGTLIELSAQVAQLNQKYLDLAALPPAVTTIPSP